MHDDGRFPRRDRAGRGRAAGAVGGDDVVEGDDGDEGEDDTDRGDGRSETAAAVVAARAAIAGPPPGGGTLPSAAPEAMFPGLGRDVVLSTAYARLAARLRRAAYQVLRDGHEAEDAVQDALLAAYRGLHRLRDPERLDAWLIRIARNQAATRARQRSRCRPDPRFARAVESPEDAGDGAIARRLRSPEPSAEAIAALREEFAALPPMWRDAFHARVVRGDGFRDIAQAQGVSVSCVKTRISRVRSRLLRAVRT